MNNTTPDAIRTVAELTDHFGAPIVVGAWTTIEQKLVDDFAELMGDAGPLHNDPAFARDTDYGGTIAQGFLTIALLPYLSVRSSMRIPIEIPRQFSINYGFDRVRFPGPVHVGARARVVISPLAVGEHDQFIQITQRETVEVEGQERPGLVADRLRRLYL